MLTCQKSADISPQKRKKTGWLQTPGNPRWMGKVHDPGLATPAPHPLHPISFALALPPPPLVVKGQMNHQGDWRPCSSWLLPRLPSLKAAPQMACLRPIQDCEERQGKVGVRGRAWGLPGVQARAVPPPSNRHLETSKSGHSTSQPWRGVPYAFQWEKSHSFHMRKLRPRRH